jgi:hypothetical protein
VFAIVSRKAAKVEDGVADDLAGTVESDVAAAIAFEEIDTAFLQDIARCDYVGGFGIAAQSDHRGVLEEEKNISYFFFFAERYELLLQPEAGRVVDSSELD